MKNYPGLSLKRIFKFIFKFISCLLIILIFISISKNIICNKENFIELENKINKLTNELYEHKYIIDALIKKLNKYDVQYKDMNFQLENSLEDIEIISIIKNS